MLYPFEICRIRILIAETDALLSFVDDGSCSDALLRSIGQLIEMIRINRFGSADKAQIDSFFDDCIAKLESKKSLLGMKLRLVVPPSIGRKLYLDEDMITAINELEASLETEERLSDYLSSLDREALLLALSLLYLGRDGVPVDVPGFEEMNGEEYCQEKFRLIKTKNKSQIIEDKMNELDKTFEKNSYIINQILGKYSRLKEYLANAKSVFTE